MRMLASLLVLVSSALLADTVVVRNAGEFVQAVLQSRNAGSGETPVIVVEGRIEFSQAYQAMGSALPEISGGFVIRGAPGAEIVATQPGFRLLAITGSALGSVILRDLSIKNFSSAENGGVILFDVGFGPGLQIEHVTFYGNHSDQRGGAIYTAGYASLAIIDSHFEKNSAGVSGGALFLSGVSAMLVSGNRFNGNQAPAGCAVTLNSRARFESNVFQGDCAHSRIRAKGPRPTLISNTFLPCRGRAYSYIGENSTSSYEGLFFGNVIGRINDVSKTLCRFEPDAEVLSLGFNLAGDSSCRLGADSDLIGFDPARSFDLFGLPTPKPGGKALDAIAMPTISTSNCPVADATGLGRPQDGNGDGVFACDIGAVEKRGAGPQVGAAMTGAYFDRLRAGEGYFVEVLENNRAFVTFFTYTAQGGSPPVTTSAPRWYFGTGKVVGNSIVLEDFFVPGPGPEFGDAYDEELFFPYDQAELSLVFPSCESRNTPARAYLHPAPFQPDDAPHYTNLYTEAYRLTGIVGCDGAPDSAKSGLSGSFYSPQRSGEGIVVQWLDADRVLMVWYTFDLDGQLLWLISGVADATGNQVTLPLYYPAQTTGFGRDFDAEEADLAPWGTATLEYTGCDTLKFSYDSSVEGYGSGSYTYQRLTQPAGTTCNL